MYGISSAFSRVYFLEYFSYSCVAVSPSGIGPNSPAIMAMMRDTWKENFTGQNPPIVSMEYKIRRLTPRECFRLMDFSDTFTWPVSDSQAYKQAGNSIVVNVLYKIIKNLNLKK